MSETRPFLRWSLLPLYVVFAYLVALRLWFDLAVSPMGDEAYYWMWGQHLSWSYSTIRRRRLAAGASSPRSSAGAIFPSAC